MGAANAGKPRITVTSPIGAAPPPHAEVVKASTLVFADPNSGSPAQSQHQLGAERVFERVEHLGGSGRASS
jgi:hypothetical protein